MRDRFHVSVIAPKRLPCFQLKIRDKRTGEVRTQMTDVPRGGRNRSRAMKEATEMQLHLNASAGCLPTRVTWDQFRERIEADFLPERAPATQVAYTSVLNIYETIAKPALLKDVDAMALKSYCRSLAASKYTDATVRKHVRHLRAMLLWASHEGLLAEVPAKPPQPPAARGKATQGKGRPLSETEVQAFLDAMSVVFRGARADEMRRLAEGMLVTGFRLGDALRATWDHTGEVYPLFREGLQPVWVFSSQQKNRCAEEVAMVPECVEFVSRTPAELRRGWFFPLSGPSGRLTAHTVSKLMSEVGRAAGITVAGANPRTGLPKYASAHDLRRTFAQNLAYTVAPNVLKHLMRHSSHMTTDRFYLGADAQAVGTQLSQGVGMPASPGAATITPWHTTEV